MRVIHEAKKVVAGHQQKCKLRGVVVNTMELVVCRCVTLLLSSCCDIPEADNMSAVRLIVAMKTPCIR